MPDTGPETMTDDHGLQPVRGVAALVEVARRRAVPMALVFAAVAGAAGLLATLWPATYRATGTLLLVVPASDARASGTASHAAESLPAVGQRVMTSEALLAIARKHDLSTADREAMVEAELLERMRRAIWLEVVDPAGAGELPSPVAPIPGQDRGIAFTISYDARTASRAAAVASDVVALFLRQNPAPDGADETEAAAALAVEIEALDRRITELERRGAGEVNPSQAQAESEQAQRQLVRLTTELDQVNARLQSPDRAAPGTPESAALVRRLEEARSWLAMDREQRPAGDPELRRLEAEVASLEQQLGDLRRRAAQDQRSALLARRDELSERITTLEEASRQRAADRETELRELREAQARVAELREQEATAAQASAESRSAERFTLLEPPRAPRAPIRPNRAMIAAIGLLLAAAAAVALAAWREKADDRLRGPRAIETLFGEAPLAVVPWLAPATAIGSQPQGSG